MALFVLAFALLLFRAEDWRDAIPLGLLAAGVTYVYSFPGLAWLGGVLGLWLIVSLISRSSPLAMRKRAPRSGDVRVTVRGTSAAWTRGRCVAGTRSRPERPSPERRRSQPQRLASRSC